MVRVLAAADGGVDLAVEKSNAALDDLRAGDEEEEDVALLGLTYKAGRVDELEVIEKGAAEGEDECE